MQTYSKWWMISALICYFWHSIASATAIETLLNENWFVTTSKHFTLVSNAEPNTVRAITIDLQRFQFYLPTIAPELKINFDAPPLVVYAFKDRKSYAQVENCDICTGFFIQSPSNNFIAINLDNYSNNPNILNTARRYLYHEYIHYAVRNAENRKHYPLWYEEGLAELFSTFLYDNTVIRIGVMRKDMWLIDFDKPFPIESVLKRRNVPKNNRDAAKYYNYALILYRYFMGSKENRAKLNQYINLLNQGKSVDRAFKQSVAPNYKTFRHKLNNYLKLVKRAYNQPRFLYLHFKLVKQFSPSKPALKPLEIAETANQLGNLLIRKNEIFQERAATLYKIALNSDPRSVPAFLGLSHYALLQKQPYHSLFYLNRALELVHTNETAQMVTMQGNIFLYLATYAFNQGNPEWTNWANRTQKSYLKALQLSADYIPAYLGLAYYYMLCDHTQHNFDRTQALSTLWRVHDVLNVATVDFLLAHLLVAQGQNDEAQELLQTITAWKKNSAIIKQAKALLKRVQN
jgi:hypothetical protein